MTDGAPVLGDGQVEVVLVVSRSPQGRTVVDVRTTEPALEYGTVELAELPLLLEALVTDLVPPDPGTS